MKHKAEKKTKSRCRMLVEFWIRLVCFVLLSGILLSYACFVLTPKFEYGILSMLNLYRQKKNTIDVLVLGTSLAYSGVNTNVLWSDYGIAAYDLCSAEQPYWNSYYYLVEALKTQQPKLIILDAKASTYPMDYTKPGRTILNTYGILSPVTRFNAIAASTKPGDTLSFALAFPQIHQNYASVSAQDFSFPPPNPYWTPDWKGFIGIDKHETHQRPSFVWTSTEKSINQRQKEYLDRILDLARERKIPVLLIGFPNPDYDSDHMYYNALWHIADDHDVAHFNFNDPSLHFGLHYTTDFADWQHLNVKGSITFTHQLGKTLDEMYSLPDRRGNAEYASYDACLAQWQGEWPVYSALDQKKEE